MNFYAGHATDIGFHYNYATGHVGHNVMGQGAVKGCGVELVSKKGVNAEALFISQHVVSMRDYRLQEVRPTIENTTLDHVLLGLGRHFENPLGELQGYAGLMGGLSVVSHHSLSEKRCTKYDFAWGAKAGCTYWIKKSVGVKFESMLLLSPNPVYAPALPNFSQPFLYTSVHQVTFLGSLVVRLGHS